MFAALRRFRHAEDQAFRDPLPSVGGIHPRGDDDPAVRAFPVQAYAHLLLSVVRRAAAGVLFEADVDACRAYTRT